MFLRQLAPNGRIFFIDHLNKKTSWVDPRTGRASPMPNAANQSQERRSEDELGPLPEGWEERVHTDGRIFFIDHSKFQVIIPLFFKYVCIFNVSIIFS